MTDRIPLFFDPVTGQICEFENGDTIDPSVPVGGVQPADLVPLQNDITTNAAGVGANTTAIAANAAALAALDLNAAIATYLDRSFASDNIVMINTTDAVLMPYITHNFTTAFAADYRIEFSFVWSLNIASSDFVSEFTVDGNVIWPHRAEPADSGGADGGTGSGTNQRYAHSYSIVLPLTAGAHTAEFSFRPSVPGGVESTVYQAYISTERFI